MFVFFFFKQKTAYEMRISDWSSDVCSSDLGNRELTMCVGRDCFHRLEGNAAIALQHQRGDRRTIRAAPPGPPREADDRAFIPKCRRKRGQPQRRIEGRLRRSEKHTSELQSLMRISYAVFCLKKKKNTNTTSLYTNQSKRQHQEH